MHQGSRQDRCKNDQYPSPDRHADRQAVADDQAGCRQFPDPDSCEANENPTDGRPRNSKETVIVVIPVASPADLCNQMLQFVLGAPADLSPRVAAGEEL